MQSRETGGSLPLTLIFLLIIAGAVLAGCIWGMKLAFLFIAGCLALGSGLLLLLYIRWKLENRDKGNKP